MPTFTRRTAQQVRAIARRVFGLTRRDHGPPVTIEICPGGLSVRLRAGGKALEYRQPEGGQAEAVVSFPFALLAECEASRDDPVTLELAGSGAVTAYWHEKGVPQTRRFDVPEDVEIDPPPLPEDFRVNGPALWLALRDVVATTDVESTRYALGCVQLRGQDGEVVATDSRQLLIQGGFDFPFGREVLLPGTSLFAARELAGIEAVEVGLTGETLVLRAGPWTVWLPTETEARFPRVDSVVPSAAAAESVLHLDDADAKFLADRIDGLPGRDEMHQPVTLDLNGTVAVRGRQGEQGRPAELVFAASRRTGRPVRLATDRQYLARAARLGFRSVHCGGPEQAVLCEDGGRRYVWMPLSTDTIVPPTARTIQIPSEKSDTAPPSNERTMHGMPGKDTDRDDRNQRSRDEPEGIDAAIEQAEAVKSALSDSLSQVRDLLSLLRQHKKQARAVRSTLESLRKLQTLDA